jgi:hypothetical protein
MRTPKEKDFVRSVIEKHTKVVLDVEGYCEMYWEGISEMFKVDAE